MIFVSVEKMLYIILLGVCMQAWVYAKVWKPVYAGKLINKKVEKFSQLEMENIYKIVCKRD